MTTHGTDWSMFRDVRNSCGPEEYRTPDEIDCRMSANVGDLMAVAMAAQGVSRQSSETLRQINQFLRMAQRSSFKPISAGRRN